MKAEDVPGALGCNEGLGGCDEKLRRAVKTVLEGWTLPADARKILEAAVYATPQPAKRVPLTEEQIKTLYVMNHWHEMGDFTWGAAAVVVRAIEAAHSIKPPNASMSGPQRPAQEVEDGTEQPGR